MLFIEIEKLDFDSLAAIFVIMLFIEIEKSVLIGGHIEAMLFIEIKIFEVDSTAAILKIC